jgi:hypothetical protein
MQHFGYDSCRAEKSRHAGTFAGSNCGRLKRHIALLFRWCRRDTSGGHDMARGNVTCRIAMVPMQVPSRVLFRIALRVSVQPCWVSEDSLRVGCHHGGGRPQKYWAYWRDDIPLSLRLVAPGRLFILPIHVCLSDCSFPCFLTILPSLSSASCHNMALDMPG